MISPSSSSTIRSTPWVEGCDGPMFRTIFSPCKIRQLRVSVTRRRARRSPARRFFELRSSCGFGHGRLLLRFDWARAVCLAMRILDVVPALDPRIQSPEQSVSGMRTRGSRAIASLPPATVTKGPPASGAGSVNATSGSSVGLPASGKSLRSGMIRIAFPHQDAAQVRMAPEPDAHHVVDLALVPIGRAPDCLTVGTSPFSSLTCGLSAADSSGGRSP